MMILFQLAFLKLLRNDERYNGKDPGKLCLKCLILKESLKNTTNEEHNEEDFGKRSLHHVKLFSYNFVTYSQGVK